MAAEGSKPIASAATRDALMTIGMSKGWSQSLERLAAEVAKI
jgi:hypothetical protein